MNKLLANKKSNLSLDSKDVDDLAERAKKLSNTNLGLLLGESFKLKVNVDKKKIDFADLFNK